MDRPLLTRDDYIVIGKLLSEYDNMKNPAIDGPDAHLIRIQVKAQEGPGGWQGIAAMTLGELKSLLKSRNDARLGVVRDQLLEYGVKVK